MPAESTDPAKTAGRLVIDAGSAPRSPATARWQDRGDLVDEAAVGVSRLHNNTMKLMVGVTEELDRCLVLRPPPMLENRMHAILLLLLLFGRHSPLWATGIQTRV